MHNGCDGQNLCFGVGLGSKVDWGCEVLAFPERKDSNILLLLFLFLIISKVYFRGASNFSKHSHISHFPFMPHCLTIAWSKSLKRPASFAHRLQMDVIQHDYIVTLMRLEGDKYIVSWVELCSTSTVLLDRWAPNLHGKEKLQCEGMRPDLGEIIHENHTCQVKNRTQSSLWTVPSKAPWKDA